MDMNALSELVRPMWVVWLLLLFLGIVFWAFRPRNRKRFEEDGMIPFGNDENGG
jgi:cytochrome c oxidase cbb3-type subunit IV